MYPLLKKTFSDAFIYSLGNLSTKIAGLILIPLYTKYLPLNEYGVLGILEVTSMAIISIIGLNLYYALLRWYYEPDYKEKTGELFYTSTIFITFFTLVIIFPMFFMARGISCLLFDSFEYSFLIILMLVSSAIQIITTLPATLMRLQEKPLFFIVTNIGRLIVTLALTLYFIIVLKWGLKGIFLAQVAGNVLYILTIVKYSFKNFTYRFNKKALKEMLWYSLPMIYASLSTMAITAADKYILKASSGLSDTGLYSFGYKIGNTVYYFVVESLNLALSPIIFNLMNRENNKRFYSKIMTYLVFIVLLIIMGMSLFSQEIIVFLAQKPEYYDAYRIIPIISLSALFMMMRDTAVRALNIVKKTNVISVTIISVSIFNILLNLMIIPHFKIYGASFAFLATQIFYFGLIYFFAQKNYYIPYEKYKLILMVTLSIIILYIGQLLFSEISWLNAFLKIVLLSIFPIVLYFLNFYETSELKKIKELITLGGRI